MIRLLIVSPMGMGNHYHGPAMSTYRLFRRMVTAHSIRITLLHGTIDQQPECDIADAVFKLPLIDSTQNSLINNLNRTRFAIAAHNWIRSRAHQFDIVYAPATNFLTLSAVQASSKKQLPSILRVSKEGSELLTSPGVSSSTHKAQLKTRLMSKAARVIAISRSIESRLLEMNIDPSRIDYIPNAADTDRFRIASAHEKRQARLTLGIPASARVLILCVGVASHRKGQHLLVEALAQLPSEVHLLLVGPTREVTFERRLQTTIDALELHSRVHRHNFMEQIEIAYRASDIFALPSDDEGMPNAVVEAMASGLPCVGTRVSGITDLISQSRGTFIERDVQDIVRALSRYLYSNGLIQSHGAASRIHIEKHQSDRVIGDRLHCVMSEVIDQTAATRSRRLPIQTNGSTKDDEST